MSSEMKQVASSVQAGGFCNVAVDAVSAHRAGVRLIDVRQPEEYSGELGHIAGTELVPLGTVAQAAAAWDKSQPLLMVCRSGGRSGQAAAYLVQIGFQEVYNMAGGMLAWNAAGLPVER